MATAIYSGTEDGYISVSGPSWGLIRGAGTGTHSHTITRYPYAVRASVASGRGGTTYFISRSFFTFNTRDIVNIPQSAILKIYGYVAGNADMYLVESNQGTLLANEDFDAIPGFSDTGLSNGSGQGTMDGHVQLYCDSEITTWSTSGYNEITLNGRALHHLAKHDTFQCVLIAKEDYEDTTPTSGTNYSGVYYADYTGTSRDPNLQIEEQDNSVFFAANF